jgi:hypothetical protein
MEIVAEEIWERNRTMALRQTRMGSLDELYDGDIELLIEENPKLKAWVTPDMDIAQAMVIKDGLLAGIDVSKYADTKWNYSQMNAILRGLEQNIDVMQWLNPSMDSRLIMEVIFARKDGLSDANIGMIADARYNGKQAFEIRQGLLDKVDVSKFANPNMTAQKMREIRLRLNGFTDWENSLMNPLDKQILQMRN